MHAQAQCWKGLSGNKTALPRSVALLRYSGYRACGVCTLQSSSFLQEIEKLKKTNAESKQVEILELRRQVAYSKMVRERSMSQ